MKALPALLAASLLLAPALHAQDAASAPAAPSPAPELAPEPAPAAAGPAPAAPAPTPVSPSGKPLDLMPTQPEPLLPPPAMPEPTLIPESPERTEKPRGTAIPQPEAERKKEKKNTTEAAENALQERIRFRQAKTRALRDPAIQAEWERAGKAHTDFEKREALKRYYKLLYARMAKLDGSLKKEIALRQNISLRRLEQRHIDPTPGRLDLSDDRYQRFDRD
jgi:hypothetical protein